MKAKISVIVPAYNTANLLEQCVESLIAQSYKNIEIIIVNDGSTDNTKAVLDSLAKKHPQIIAVHKENGGVTSARIEGIKMATGEYIGFADSDDTADSDMFERLIENAEKYNADISHCGYKMVFPDGKVDYYYNSGKLIMQSTLTSLADLLSGEFVEPGLVNKLFKAELFDKSDVFQRLDRSIKINEDLLMNYYLFSVCSSAVYEDFCPYNYLMRAESASKVKVSEHKLDDPIKVIRQILDDPERPSGLDGVLLSRLTRHLITLSTLSVKSQKELILPRRKAARKELRQRIFTIIKKRDISLKLKTMAAVTAIFPSFYAAVHNSYARISGIDKKYDVQV